MMVSISSPSRSFPEWRNQHRPTSYHQHGVALVVALIFLLMLTMLGVTVMQTASLEGRMAANTQESNRAFQGAQSAIDYIMTDYTLFASLAQVGDVAGPQQPPYSNVAVDVTAKLAATTNKLPRTRSLPQVMALGSYGGAIIELTGNAKTSSQANSITKQGMAQIRNLNSN